MDPRERQARLRRYMAKVAPQLLEDAPRDQEVVESVESMERDRPVDLHRLEMVEAIIHREHRPSLLVQEGDFAVPVAPWEHLAEGAVHERLTAAMPAIGRVEGRGGRHIGTGFVIGPGLLLTNRHVALDFVKGVDELVFRSGLSAQVDFLRELDRLDERVVKITGIRCVHRHWDAAVLEIDGELPQPLGLSGLDPAELDGREVAVIGYPAKSRLHPADLQRKIFGDSFGVKRLQPGKLGPMETFQAQPAWPAVKALTHDASTLGGNSGSAVIDLGTGLVVGLHYAGLFEKSNYAVSTVDLLRDAELAPLGLHAAAPVPVSTPESDAGPITVTSTSVSTTAVPGGSTTRVNLRLEITVRVEGGEPIVASTDVPIDIQLNSETTHGS